MSEMEVSNLRNPGDLVFSSDNEIMSVAVKGDAVIAPGNLVTFDSNSFAQKGTHANLSAIVGFGVCIYEGVDNTGGGDGDKLVQIVTGNGYVTMLAGATVKPFSKIIPDSSSRAVGAALAANANVAAVVTFLTKVIGRSYGNPGQMVKPTNVTNNNPIIVRLGSD